MKSGYLIILALSALLFFQISILGYYEVEETHLEEIYVEARQWAWDFYQENGTKTTDILSVFVNQTYKLKVTSVDVNHGLRINAGGVNVDILAITGTNNTADIVFTELGVFEISCSVRCGAGHGSMNSDVNATKDPKVTITVTKGSETLTTTTTEETTILQTVTDISRFTVDETIVITETVGILSVVHVISFVAIISLVRSYFKKITYLRVK